MKNQLGVNEYGDLNYWFKARHSCDVALLSRTCTLCVRIYKFSKLNEHVVLRKLIAHVRCMYYFMRGNVGLRLRGKYISPALRKPKARKGNWSFAWNHNRQSVFQPATADMTCFWLSELSVYWTQFPSSCNKPKYTTVNICVLLGWQTSIRLILW